MSVRYKCHRQAESFCFFPADHFARTRYYTTMTEDTRPKRGYSDRPLPSRPIRPPQRREEDDQIPLRGYASSELPPTVLGRERSGSRPSRRPTASGRRRDRRAEERHAEEQDRLVEEQHQLAKANRHDTEAKYKSQSRSRSRDPERRELLGVSTRNRHRRERSGSRSLYSRSQRSRPEAQDHFLRVSTLPYPVLQT